MGTKKKIGVGITCEAPLVVKVHESYTCLNKFLQLVVLHVHTLAVAMVIVFHGMQLLQWYASVSKHKLSQGSWVCFLDSSVLCLYLLGEAPPTSCYHGDCPSWVNCLQGSEEVFSVLNSMRVDCEIKLKTSLSS